MNTTLADGFWIAGVCTDSSLRKYRVRAIWDEAGTHMRSSRDPKNPLRRYRLVKIYL